MALMLPARTDEVGDACTERMAAFSRHVQRFPAVVTRLLLGFQKLGTRPLVPLLISAASAPSAGMSATASHAIAVFALPQSRPIPQPAAAIAAHSTNARRRHLSLQP